MVYRWESGIEHPRLGMCALNPHNGENGAFGRQEIDHIRPAVETAREKGIDIQGPFPCDTIFLKREHFDGIVTMYHDQGQIAMKLLSFVLLATASGAFAIPGLDIDASITLPVLGEINLAKLTKVVHIDQSRAMVMKHRMQASTFQRRQSASVDATNTAVSRARTSCFLFV